MPDSTECRLCGGVAEQTARIPGTRVTTVREECQAPDCSWFRIRTVGKQTRLGEVDDAE